MTVDEAISELTQAKRGRNLRCNDLIKLLEDLGFEVKPGKNPGHYSFKHPRIPEFFGASFGCGHGKNESPKQSYIQDTLRVVRLYQEQLRDFE